MVKTKLTQIKPFLEELTWKEVRPQVLAKNPELAKAIDSVSPGEKYSLFKLTCPYGTEILKKGKLYLPNADGDMVSLDDPSISKHFRESLSYNLESNPVTLVLKNTLELFLSLDDRTVPFYGAIKPGSMFGLWRILNPVASHQAAFIWDMTAGSRSLFMLPKITEVEKHKKLKRLYQISIDVPKNYMDHWHIFRELANHPTFPEPWNVEILFFSDKWFLNLDDSAWSEFNLYLYKLAWQSSEFWRNKFFLDLMVSIVLKNKNIKTSGYIADTVKYLFAIGLGALPGLAPATDSLIGPIAGLQEVYINDYNLKDYVPTIMVPTLLNIDEKKSRPIYYSLSFPNAVNFSPKSRERTSLLTDLFEIKSFFNKCWTELQAGQFNLKETPLQELIKKIGFDFFHSNVELYSGIRESEEIGRDDPSFSYMFNNDNTRTFSDANSFVRGCIKIYKK